ncbi:MAG: hypothetical protein PQJ59_08200 [Spirochaetales bacterium]|nr:hypothetical protein [Spirochaetales bacterium]
MKKIAIVLISFTLFFSLAFTGCDDGSGSGGSSDGGDEIDLTDPLAVLESIPDELSASDVLEISRATTEPTGDSQVYNGNNTLDSNETGDTTYAYSFGPDIISTAALAHSLNLILKKLSDLTDDPSIVDSGTPISLESMDLGADIMEPLNAAADNYVVDYKGVMINTLPALDGVTGFGYYLPFSFEHYTGTLDLYSYFELYTEDADNMVLRALTYISDGTTYYKYHTSVMTIVDGEQTIQLYENNSGDDTSWTYDHYTYNPTTGETQVYIINNSGSWNAIFADEHGSSLAMTETNSDNTISSSIELADQDGIIMSQLQDDDLGSLVPEVYSDTFLVDSTNYAYRYLEDNTSVTGGDSASLLSVVSLNYYDGTTGEYSSYAFPDVTDDTSDHFLLGTTNTVLTDYLFSSLTDYIGTITTDLDDNLNASGTAPVWTEMDPTNLGVSDHSALSTEFDKFSSL